MNAIVEKVAKALWEHGGLAKYESWESPDNGLRNAFRESAEAAIAAMRDPPLDDAKRYTDGMYSRRNIEAFIDDALGKADDNATEEVA